MPCDKACARTGTQWLALRRKVWVEPELGGAQNVHPEVKYKEPPSQYNLYQKCGLMDLISGCVSRYRSTAVTSRARKCNASGHEATQFGRVRYCPSVSYARAIPHDDHDLPDSGSEREQP
eukprot:2240578-Rhodomonas_salina.1